MEDISIQSLFGRQLPFTDCLVEIFSSDIFGSNFIFKSFLVEIFFLGGGVDFSLKYFLVGVSFEKCFVEILVQGVCGRNVSSNTFLVEVSAGICLA